MAAPGLALKSIGTDGVLRRDRLVVVATQVLQADRRQWTPASAEWGPGSSAGHHSLRLAARTRAKRMLAKPPEMESRVSSRSPVPHPAGVRLELTPVRAGAGAVTPGITSKERFSGDPGRAGLTVALAAELVLEMEGETGRGLAVVGAVAGASRTGGVSGGAWSCATVTLAQQSNPVSAPAKSPLIIPILTFRIAYTSEKLSLIPIHRLADRALPPFFPPPVRFSVVQAAALLHRCARYGF